jgi:hypothetical protein
MGNSRPGPVIRQRCGFDIERCERGGQLTIIAAIKESNVISRIPTHLGLPAREAPRAQMRPLALFHTA